MEAAPAAPQNPQPGALLQRYVQAAVQSSSRSTKDTRALLPAGHGTCFSFPAEYTSPARCSNKTSSGGKHLPQPPAAPGRQGRDEHSAHKRLSTMHLHTDLTFAGRPYGCPSACQSCSSGPSHPPVFYLSYA